MKFMPYVCCGDPSAGFTIKLVKTLVYNGADAIELGIPFSDPVADGKTIQAAGERALKNGMTPKKAVDIIKELKTCGVAVPIYVMTYYNIILANGNGRFVSELAHAGVNGLIVPDVPLEESNELHDECRKNRIDLIYLIAPNSSNDRIKKINKLAGGFIYAVSVLGTTGSRKKISNEAKELVKRAKKIIRLPVVVGFGVSKPEHVKELVITGADGVIAGSEIVDIYSKFLENGKFNEEKALEEIARFAKSMKEASQ